MDAENQDGNKFKIAAGANGYVPLNTDRQTKFDIPSKEEQFTFDGDGGEITKKIGTGKNAKNSVVWHIISATLLIFCSFTAALIVIDLFATKGKSSLQILKDTWATFTPIITLALGYMFGVEPTTKALSIKRDSASSKNSSQTDC